MSKLVQIANTLGLHPLVGFGVFAVDWMLFSAEGATLGASWVVSVGVGVVLAIASTFIQKHVYKEAWGLAIGKGLMLGLLTAIPTALPSFVPAAGGAMGAVALLSPDKALPESSQG